MNFKQVNRIKWSVQRALLKIRVTDILIEEIILVSYFYWKILMDIIDHSCFSVFLANM